MMAKRNFVTSSLTCKVKQLCPSISRANITIPLISLCNRPCFKNGKRYREAIQLLPNGINRSWIWTIRVPETVVNMHCFNFIGNGSFSTPHVQHPGSNETVNTPRCSDKHPIPVLEHGEIMQRPPNVPINVFW